MWLPLPHQNLNAGITVSMTHHFARGQRKKNVIHIVLWYRHTSGFKTWCLYLNWDSINKRSPFWYKPSKTWTTSVLLVVYVDQHYCYASITLVKICFLPFYLFLASFFIFLMQKRKTRLVCHMFQELWKKFLFFSRVNLTGC